MELSHQKIIRDLLSRHGFSFSKRLGQNFLINPSVCPRMAAACGASETSGVLEIGPGIGVLTVELAKMAKKVVAMEIDDRLRPILAETLAPFQNTSVIWGDVMTADLTALLRDEFGGMPVDICANLPYYITTPIIMRLLEEKLPVRSITVMVQKEAAVRLCAPPGTRACGAISAPIWYYTQPKILFPVSRGSFMPPPEVDSAVIQLVVRPEPPVAVLDETLFFKVVRASFAMRRKTILNCLSSGFGLPKDELMAAILAAGIDPTRRAETLTLGDFATLTSAISLLLPAPPVKK